MDHTPSYRLSQLTEAEVFALNQTFADAKPQDVLSWLALYMSEYPVPLVSSFGADSVVLLHMVSRIDRDYPVLFIDTGKHFDETLFYRDQIRDQFGLANLHSILPDGGELKHADPFGAMWMADSDACCDLRKTRPLDRAMAGYAGWITGRKRFQTQERAGMELFELEDGKLKVNPLANWGPENVSAYVKANSLPGHPLIPKGFLSIGCAPCTSPVEEGQDARSGRWKGQQKTECGIHISNQGKNSTSRVAKEPRL